MLAAILKQSCMISLSHWKLNMRPFALFDVPFMLITALRRFCRQCSHMTLLDLANQLWLIELSGCFYIHLLYTMTSAYPECCRIFGMHFFTFQNSHFVSMLYWYLQNSFQLLLDSVSTSEIIFNFECFYFLLARTVIPNQNMRHGYIHCDFPIICWCFKSIKPLHTSSRLTLRPKAVEAPLLIILITASSMKRGSGDSLFFWGFLSYLWNVCSGLFHTILEWLCHYISDHFHGHGTYTYNNISGPGEARSWSCFINCLPCMSI